MKFRTEIEVAPWVEPIGYSQRIVSLGSCFATNIAQRLHDRKFNVTSSPTGILFNPASIAAAVRDMVEGRIVTPEELISLNGNYVSYRFHSSVSGATPEATAEHMNETLRAGGEAIKQANLINKPLIAKLYHISEESITELVYFDQAMGIKVTYDRKISSGTIGDRDVYGAQQHAPLMLLEVDDAICG